MRYQIPLASPALIVKLVPYFKRAVCYQRSDDRAVEGPAAPICASVGQYQVARAFGADRFDALKAANIAAISVGAFKAIGEMFTKSSGFFKQGGWGHILTHATTGGILTELQGGKFGHGFVSAGITKRLTNVQVAAANSGGLFAGTIVAAIIGVTVSEVTGGKFANGAQTAAFQFLFNALSQKHRNNPQHKAAQRASRAAHAGTAEDGRERGGLIYRDKNRDYDYTRDLAVQEGGRAEVDVWSTRSQVPKGATVVGFFHSHPSDNRTRTTGYFSPTDIDIANYEPYTRSGANRVCYPIEAYVVVPNGDIEVYSPFLEDPRSIIGNID